MKQTDSSLQYTLDILMQIAFPNISFSIKIKEDDISVILSERFSLSFALMDEAQSESLLQGKLRLSTLRTPWGHSVPIYQFSSDNNYYTVNNQKITFLCDLLTIPFIMLSRYEEKMSVNKDIHERYLAENSIATYYQFIDYPIVDEYAMMIRHWVCALFPEIQVQKRESQLIATHDIDIISRFGGLIKNIRTILGGDLLNRRSWSMTQKSFNQYQKYRDNKNKDPYIIAIEMLLKLSLNAKASAKFFFKALVDHENDATYNIYQPEVEYIIKKIEAAGMEVGLHGSYASYNDCESFQREKSRLEEVCEHVIKSQRQHYLRFDWHRSVDVWESSGITDDYTLGYAEREGFRCGTSHPFKLYHLQKDRPSNVTEHPLIAMDGTFFQYRNLDTQTSLIRLKELWHTCQLLEGDFVILWHNTTVFREYENWYQEVFRRFMEEI